MGLEWAPALGYFIFWIGLIASIILYATKRKWNLVMYLVSLCLYVFTFGFIIDAFDIGKNGVLLLLAFSALVMILIGFYISSKFNKDKQ